MDCWIRATYFHHLNERFKIPQKVANYKEKVRVHNRHKHYDQNNQNENKVKINLINDKVLHPQPEKDQNIQWKNVLKIIIYERIIAFYDTDISMSYVLINFIVC